MKKGFSEEEDLDCRRAVICGYPWVFTSFQVPLFSSSIFFFLMVVLNGKECLLVDVYMTTSPQARTSERAVGKIIRTINYLICK